MSSACTYCRRPINPHDIVTCAATTHAENAQLRGFLRWVMSKPVTPELQAEIRAALGEDPTDG